MVPTEKKSIPRKDLRGKDHKTKHSHRKDILKKNSYTKQQDLEVIKPFLNYVKEYIGKVSKHFSQQKW